MNRRIRRHAPAFVHPEVFKLGLKPVTGWTLIALNYWGGENGRCKASLDRIRKEVQCSKTSAKLAVDELVELGLIARVTSPKQGGGSSSIYYVLDRREWVEARDPDGPNEDPSESIPAVHMGTTGGSQMDRRYIGDEVPSYKSPNSSAKPKKGRAKKIDLFLPTDLVPTEWIDEEFLSDWRDWAELRPARTLTRGSAKKASKVLAESGSRANALAILAKSIASGWQGLFPLKGGNGSTARDFDKPNDDIVNELLK